MCFAKKKSLGLLKNNTGNDSSDDMDSFLNIFLEVIPVNQSQC